MATIGLNDGPYLIFTVTYEKGNIIIADGAELRIPTIILNQQDSLTLSHDFTHLETPIIPVDAQDQRPTLIPITDDARFINSTSSVHADVKDFMPFPSRGDDCFILIPDSTHAEQPPVPVTVDTVPRITLFAIVHSVEYLLTISKEVYDGKIRTYLQVCNPKYSVKGFFNEGAGEFFDYVYHDLLLSKEQLF